MAELERPWVDGLTIGQVFTETVSRHGDRDAVVFPMLNLRWSYSEYEKHAQATARGLLALGVKPGDHVGIWSPNCPEWLTVQYGAAMIGAVLINLNPAYQTHDAGFVIGQADITVLFVYDRFKSSDYESMTAELIDDLATMDNSEEIRNQSFPALRHVVSLRGKPSVSGILPWTQFLEQGADVSDTDLAESPAEVTPDQPINLQFTSGTTGTPKGAMLSHRNVLMNAWHMGNNFRYTELDRVCCPLPFFHCFGCVAGSLTCVVFGAAIVVPGETFVPDDTLSAMAQEKCTSSYGVPTMFNAMVHSPNFSQFRLDSLRTGIMGGSPCPIELMRKVMNEMHLPEMTIGYGLTESSPCITVTAVDEAIEDRVSTVGRPIPGVEVRLIDPATGEVAHDGQQGELETRGHNVMLGYYKLPEATNEAIREDGWLKTGDLAIRTENGLYRITGRIKDMVIRGGENIYPAEIEEFILSHPNVHDVAVVGVPDNHFGEQLLAWIVPKGDQQLTRDEIVEYCRNRIAHYKVPHYVACLESLPLFENGKVQRTKLREMGAEQFGT